MCGHLVLIQCEFQSGYQLQYKRLTCAGNGDVLSVYLADEVFLS